MMSVSFTRVCGEIKNPRPFSLGRGYEGNGLMAMPKFLLDGNLTHHLADLQDVTSLGEPNVELLVITLDMA